MEVVHGLNYIVTYLFAVFSLHVDFFCLGMIKVFFQSGTLNILHYDVNLTAAVVSFFVDGVCLHIEQPRDVLGPFAFCELSQDVDFSYQLFYTVSVGQISFYVFDSDVYSSVAILCSDDTALRAFAKFFNELVSL